MLALLIKRYERNLDFDDIKSILSQLQYYFINSPWKKKT